MRKIRILWLFCCAFVLFGSGISNLQAQENPKNGEEKVTVKTETEKQDSEKSGISDALRKEIEKVQSEQVAIQNTNNDLYRIGFQDTLEVQVFNQPKLSQAVNVNPDGTIRLFRIDNPVVAVCKTERELAYTIETLYKNYLRTPRVNVRVIEQKSQPFAVIGAVQKPGSFYLSKKTRLIQLLALAGGFDVENAGMNIAVARIGNVAGCGATQDDQNQEVKYLSFNMQDILEGKENPWMEPGDIVTVLEAEQAYVVGNVEEPTKIALKSPTTLTQAIAIAKGFSKNAQTDKVIIERQERGNPIKTELVYSLKDIRDKKAPDPFIQANDIVIVSTDNKKAIASGFMTIFKQTLPGLVWGL